MIYPPYDTLEIVEINDLYIFTTKGEVLRSTFDEWLRSSGSLEWCLDTCDHTGEHVQKTGEYTIDEYYEMAERDTNYRDSNGNTMIIADIIAYSTEIIKHRNKPNNRIGIMDMGASFEKWKKEGLL